MDPILKHNASGRIWWRLRCLRIPDSRRIVFFRWARVKIKNPRPDTASMRASWLVKMIGIQKIHGLWKKNQHNQVVLPNHQGFLHCSNDFPNFWNAKMLIRIGCPLKRSNGLRNDHGKEKLLGPSFETHPQQKNILSLNIYIYIYALYLCICKYFSIVCAYAYIYIYTYII